MVLSFQNLTEMTCKNKDESTAALENWGRKVLVVDKTV